MGSILSGFQQQQVQMARDHGEQMELIRKLKDKMEKEKEGEVRFQTSAFSLYIQSTHLTSGTDIGFPTGSDAE
jgi:hemerythrin-like domain-containing protein